MNLTHGAMLFAALACHQATPPESPVTDPNVDADGAEDVSALLEGTRAKHELPAMGGAIVGADGELLAVGVSGERVAGSGVSVSVEDPWHLGSNTKALTATLAALLVEDGTIGWETSVRDVWPEVDPAWSEVNLLLLLQNRGGVGGEIAGKEDLWNGLWQAEDPGQGRADMVEALLRSPPDGTVGAFAYSNFGFILAGHMLEAKAGEDWEVLMRTRLFEPLGMQSCGFGPPLGDVPQGHHQGEDGYTAAGQGLAADNPRGVGPAGTVYCSLADYGRFLGLHLRRGQGTAPLLSAQSFQTLHTPEGEYAAGWGVVDRPWAGGTALTHSGSNTMWFGTVWLAPEIGRAYIVQMNAAPESAPLFADEAIVELARHDGRL